MPSQATRRIRDELGGALHVREGSVPIEIGPEDASQARLGLRTRHAVAGGE
jgi:hypothetical protein